jgi:hypothetical protein
MGVWFREAVLHASHSQNNDDSKYSAEMKFLFSVYLQFNRNEDKIKINRSLLPTSVIASAVTATRTCTFLQYSFTAYEDSLPILRFSLGQTCGLQ